MSKRFGLVVLVLLAVPLLLAACASESQDAATEYTRAILKGDGEKALEYACEGYADTTQELAAYYGERNVTSTDLKFDIGKGGDQSHITVTGSYQVNGEDGLEIELAQSTRIRGMLEQYDTRIIVTMDEQDGDWCVSDFEDKREEFIHELGAGESAETEAG